jgi:hypothetical protein
LSENDSWWNIICVLNFILYFLFPDLKIFNNVLWYLIHILLVYVDNYKHGSTMNFWGCQILVTEIWSKKKNKIYCLLYSDEEFIGIYQCSAKKFLKYKSVLSSICREYTFYLFFSSSSSFLLLLLPNGLGKTDCSDFISWSLWVILIIPQQSTSLWLNSRVMGLLPLGLSTFPVFCRG